MAPDVGLDDIQDIQDLQHALRTANLELSLERSKHSVEFVAKDEDIRKLRLQLLISADEKDDLYTQLSEEEARSDGLEQALDEALAQLEQLQVDNASFQNDMRTHSRTITNLKAELKAMENVTSDSNKLLSEKLTLTHEMASLKPEVEHLRAQVDSNQGLLAEKLSLQRQLNTLQVELENEKRTTARSVAKKDRKAEQDDDMKAEVESLQKELTREKRDRERAEKSLDKAEKTTEKLQEKLDSQKEAMEAALANAEKASKKATDKANKSNDSQDTQLSDLRQELEQEKRERVKREKSFHKSISELESKNAIQEDKLNQFRAKLKTTKEKLKETEAEIETVRSMAAIRQSVEPTTKNPRKRTAAPSDPDAAMGTPGDGLPAKRKKRAVSAAVGDKSTFSITPFLNRTASVAPEDDEPAAEAKDDDEAVESTPSALSKKAQKKAAEPKPKPLAPSSSSKVNAKTGGARKKTNAPTLEKVVEEGSELGDDNSENAAPAPTTSNSKGERPEKAQVSKLKSSSRPLGHPRKSLMSFAAFNQEAEPERKKKRKMLGGGNTSGLGKTLFDVEEDTIPSKPIPGKGLFASKALGKSLLAKGPGLIKGGFMMTTADGFQFSPLKKDRRSASMLKG